MRDDNFGVCISIRYVGLILQCLVKVSGEGLDINSETPSLFKLRFSITETLRTCELYVIAVIRCYGGGTEPDKVA